MTLPEILSGITVTKMVHKEPWQGPNWTGIRLEGVRYDSRKVKKGDLYVAIRGEKMDGHRFIPDAVSNGARVVIVEDDLALSDSFFTHAGVVKVVVPVSRKALAITSRNFYADPSRNLMLIGVTGTNGKTTTTQLIGSILEASGRRTGIIGTIGYYDGRDSVEARHTTPEAPELNELLSSMVKNGCTAAVMEVSSHSLVMDRVYGLRFAGAAFTNLTQDHLDFHKTMDDYFEAKKILFDALDVDAVAVTNLDDPFGTKITGETKARRIRYGRGPEGDLVCTASSTGLAGTSLTVEYGGVKKTLNSPLIGAFNVSNILAATGVSLGLGVSFDAVAAGVASLRSVRGRFEPIQSEQGWTAVVDYAHTPDALENTLKAIRALLGASGGKIVTIFGCGGDRDRTKRPLMGGIATRLSDLTIVTSDNPRSEDPEAIINEILAGAAPGANVSREQDRRKAILDGLTRARRGDVVLIAGKGHEDYQIIGDRKLHLDDREEVLKFLGRQWN